MISAGYSLLFSITEFTVVYMIYRRVFLVMTFLLLLRKDALNVEKYQNDHPR